MLDSVILEPTGCEERPVQSGPGWGMEGAQGLQGPRPWPFQWKQDHYQVPNVVSGGSQDKPSVKTRKKKPLCHDFAHNCTVQYDGH